MESNGSGYNLGEWRGDIIIYFTYAAIYRAVWGEIARTSSRELRFWQVTCLEKPFDFFGNNIYSLQ